MISPFIDIEEQLDCATFIFENAEQMPDDFYLGIMNLIKIFHFHGNNSDEIHKFLEKNKHKIDNSLFEKIKSYFPIKENKREKNKACVFISIVLISIIVGSTVGFFKYF